MKSTAFVLLICVCFTNLSFANELVVRHIKPISEKDHRNTYFVELLKLALEKTRDSHGGFVLEESELVMQQSRAIAFLAANRNLDVVWTMTSQEREKLLNPVRVPLLKGLLGHRIFIIRKGDQSRFAAIKDLTSLREMTAGQGHDWPDSHILRASGITVRVSSDYEGLFKMLASKRFDYFPRGVNEPFDEVASRSELELTVEPKLLIKYAAPIFFFTNAKNTQLAERLRLGLEKALDDGSFDKVLHHHPSTKLIFEQANIQDRRIFEIDNPLLTDETEQLRNQPRYWYVPGEELLAGN